MKYKKPKIKTKKIKASFLFSRRNFFDFGFLADMTDGEPPVDPCFLPGTKILLADRETKTIETMKVGDLILSYDTRKNRLLKEPVVQVLKHVDNNNDCFLVNNFLRVTANHPVWVNGSLWKRVDELCKNDVLLNSDGKQIVVESIKKIKKVNVVFNLHLAAKQHNYFAENILVHNKQPCRGC